MTVRDTSLEAYERIIPLLSEMRRKVYEAFFPIRPATAAETAATPSFRNAPPHLVRNVNTRLGELARMGVLYEVRERECRVSGHMAIEYDVTNRLPIALPKAPGRKTRKQLETENALLLEQIAKLEAENARLRALLDDHLGKKAAKQLRLPMNTPHTRGPFG